MPIIGIFRKNYPIFATYTNPNPFIMKKVLLIMAAILLAYNPQNEMFARFGTKCYPTQNETFFF